MPAAQRLPMQRLTASADPCAPRFDPAPALAAASGSPGSIVTSRGFGTGAASRTAFDVFPWPIRAFRPAFAWSSHAPFLLCRRSGTPVVDPCPGFLREPALVFPGHADDQRPVVLVEVRFEALPDAFGTELAIDQPSRSQIVPPGTAALDGLVEGLIVLTLFFSGRNLSRRSFGWCSFALDADAIARAPGPYLLMRHRRKFRT